MGKKTLEEKYLKYNPEEDSNGAQGIELADQIIEKYGSIENAMKVINKYSKGNKEDKDVKLAKKENDLEKVLIFVKRADGMSINPDNLYANREAKEQLIRELKGDKTYLPGFSDYKIGTIFRGIYRSALKKSQK